ncbi:MAG: glycosyltransferase family 4 protein, partial [Syntrophales bacterium]|nr:glycosyltransferase family 4 protein [Syntrophales bacterium]
FRLDPRPRIVAISQMIKTDMESFFRVKGTEIEVVYNGVDTSRYNRNLYHELRGPLRKQLGIKEDDVVFLFISYDLKKKGIESLVEAASKLKISGKNNFKIIVIGGLPYGSLSRQIKNLNLEDMIIFTGQIRSTEEYYANSDVFVLPTYYDACSLVVIEAMACGLPSITTTANGASGIITDGENGYIITHPPDPADLADKMNLLMAYENRKKMSKEAFRIGQDYSTKRNHHDMIRIFNEVITSKK